MYYSLHRKAELMCITYSKIANINAITLVVVYLAHITNYYGSDWLILTKATPIGSLVSGPVDFQIRMQVGLAITSL